MLSFSTTERNWDIELRGSRLFLLSTITFIVRLERASSLVSFDDLFCKCIDWFELDLLGSRSLLEPLLLGSTHVKSVFMPASCTDKMT